MSLTFDNESRKQWHRNDAPASNDDLKVGCLQRIAAATELMARSHAKLEADRDYYRESYKDEQTRTAYLIRSNAALRGVITKLKAR